MGFEHSIVTPLGPSVQLSMHMPRPLHAVPVEIESHITIGEACIDNAVSKALGQANDPFGWPALC